MKKISFVPAAAFLAALALGAGNASARVVCNAEGDCWHTDNSYHYKSEVKIEVHPDSWYFHHDWDQDKDHHWRGHHEGRGYWKNGAWVTF